MKQLLSIMARLRDPNGGCPWDLEQDFGTIAPYTIEEAYEVAEAIAKGDRSELREELGDLLLQVVFHAQMAAEEGSFDFADVVQSISDKMIRRHPHVFADAEIKTAAAQTENWETIKAAERAGKKRERILDDVPAALPALLRAQKLQARAARVGFDWPEVSGVLAKIREELAEVEAAIANGAPAAVAEELGDLLFAVTNLARFTGQDAETCLRGTNAKFTRRFEYIEDRLAEEKKPFAEATLDDMEALWNEAKMKERA
ncbi:MAG: nucleoside triphosphate pyrophosphohydrolase [Alphaproteobacteria bacterium]|nr:nucleoside triphosphate pyrophosphohydrolase [Alphaproteobacteria bacterium]